MVPSSSQGKNWGLPQQCIAFVEGYLDVPEPHPDDPVPTGDLEALLSRLRAGDAKAAEWVWSECYPKLAQVAQRRLSRHLVAADGEDVAASAMRTFYRRMSMGQFPSIADVHDLWALLTTLTVRKANDLRKREYASKRDSARTTRDHDLLQGIPVNAPTAEMLAYFGETLERLLDPLDEQQRDVLLLRLQGLRNDEIASQVGISQRTVERWISQVRKQWRDWEQAKA
jgi:RNA polymerase sigma factor (sigma-70 family)